MAVIGGQSVSGDLLVGSVSRCISPGRALTARKQSGHLSYVTVSEQSVILNMKESMSYSGNTTLFSY